MSRWMKKNAGKLTITWTAEVIPTLMSQASSLKKHLNVRHHHPKSSFNNNINMSCHLLVTRRGLSEDWAITTKSAVLLRRQSLPCLRLNLTFNRLITMEWRGTVPSQAISANTTIKSYHSSSNPSFVLETFKTCSDSTLLLSVMIKTHFKTIWISLCQTRRKSLGTRHWRHNTWTNCSMKAGNRVIITQKKSCRKLLQIKTLLINSDSM